MKLKYTGASEGELECGTYINVPTNWPTSIRDYVTKKAIAEIMKALDDEYIYLYDYDYVFMESTAIDRLATDRNPALEWWRKDR